VFEYLEVFGDCLYGDWEWFGKFVDGCFVGVQGGFEG